MKKYREKGQAGFPESEDINKLKVEREKLYERLVKELVSLTEHQVRERVRITKQYDTEVRIIDDKINSMSGNASKIVNHQRP